VGIPVPEHLFRIWPVTYETSIIPIYESDLNSFRSMFCSWFKVLKFVLNPDLCVLPKGLSLEVFYAFGVCSDQSH